VLSAVRHMQSNKYYAVYWQFTYLSTDGVCSLCSQ